MLQRERIKNFIDFICKQCMSDKGIAAHLRRADIKPCDPIVLSTLIRFDHDLDITKDKNFIPYCLVTAAIAREKKYVSGECSFVQLLSLIETKNDKNESRIRRLLACESLSDLSLIPKSRPNVDITQN